MIDPEQVRHVAALARLALTEVELDRLRQQLGQILEAFEALNELDVEQISPTAQVIPLTNIERDDRARPSLRPEQVMQNAPRIEAQQIRVPAVLDES
jgi:aspartyl-tRNA(Asn)/glutamyl-tRNA(Gln) amidotransferase subunit C